MYNAALSYLLHTPNFFCPVPPLPLPDDDIFYYYLVKLCFANRLIAAKCLIAEVTGGTPVADSAARLLQQTVGRDESEI